ncbi:MAG: zinc dependent phospholipase C family protein [Oscillospiraceae bacterium]|nr:zinc dependent phospholipase C family protein [Oscillospiraceae bacterium]
MPGIISHYLFAQSVFDALSKKPEFKSIDKTALLWGSQGPDIFFYHRFFPWDRGEKLIPYGSRLHREDPSLLFEVMRNYENTEPALTQISLSYQYGMAAHYILDRTAHPFVNAGIKQLEELEIYPKTYNIHVQIESSLDIILLRSILGLTPVDFNLKKAIPQSRELKAFLPDFYGYVLRHRFGVKPSTAALERLYPDLLRMFGLLNNRGMIKKPMVEFAEKLLKMKGAFSVQLRGITEGPEWDYANIGNLEWSNPLAPEAVYTTSFFELFEDAVNEAVLFITDYSKALSSNEQMSRLTGRISFDTGVSGS